MNSFYQTLGNLFIYNTFYEEIKSKTNVDIKGLNPRELHNFLVSQGLLLDRFFVGKVNRLMVQIPELFEMGAETVADFFVEYGKPTKADLTHYATILGLCCFDGLYMRQIIDHGDLSPLPINWESDVRDEARRLRDLVVKMEPFFNEICRSWEAPIGINESQHTCSCGITYSEDYRYERDGRYLVYHKKEGDLGRGEVCLKFRGQEEGRTVNTGEFQKLDN